MKTANGAKEKEHCCVLMQQFLDEKKVAINYSPVFRGYSIRLTSSLALQMIYYGPWCGIKLPKHLHDDYFEILENEYTIDDDRDAHIPQEFKSDQWWKKRGL